MALLAGTSPALQHRGEADLPRRLVAIVIGGLRDVPAYSLLGTAGLLARPADVERKRVIRSATP